jgi:hypothetical protein
VCSLDSTGTPLSDISERLENLRYTSPYLLRVCVRARACVIFFYIVRLLPSGM